MFEIISEIISAAPGRALLASLILIMWGVLYYKQIPLMAIFGFSALPGLIISAYFASAMMVGFMSMFSMGLSTKPVDPFEPGKKAVNAMIDKVFRDVETTTVAALYTIATIVVALH